MDEGRCKTRHALKEVEKNYQKVLSGKTEDLEAPIFHGPIISGSEGWSMSKLISQSRSPTLKQT